MPATPEGGAVPVAERLARLSPDKRKVFDQLLGDARGSAPIPVRRRSPGADRTTLSFAQQRLWFVEQLVPGTTMYNIPSVLRLRAPIDAAALERSINEIVRRHEALRTTFQAIDGLPFQIVAAEATVPLALDDLRGLPAAEREAAAAQLAGDEVQRPFDLATGPLLRARLVQLGSADFVFVLAMHHIVTDGWSMTLLVRELSTLYTAFAQGRPSPLPELTIQYPDYAVWQRTQLTGDTLQGLLDYWSAQLKDLPVLALPTDHPRPPIQAFRGASQPLTLPAPLTTQLRALGQHEGATLFMTLLAGFAALLHRYTDQDDLPIGAPIAGRTRPETEPLIGFFVNTLVLRTNTHGNPSFRELIQRTRATALDAYAHQDLPFETLVEHLQPHRDLSRNPLFQVMLQLQSSAPGEGAGPELEQPQFEINRGTAIFDLALSFWDDSRRLAGAIEYSADLFDADTITRLAGHLTTLLSAAAAHPDQPISTLPLLTPDEHHTLQAWAQTSAPYPRNTCIHHLIEHHAATQPHATALVYADQHLTYHQLNTHANHLAHRLQTHGITRDTLVAVCLPRSLTLPIALLAILKAGGAYLPLDPTYPPQRLAFMLKDADAQLILTQESLASVLPADGARTIHLDPDPEEPDDASAATAADPEVDVDASALAYVIYTSGSTGRPKGALIEHRGLCNVAAAQQRTFGVGPGSRVLQFSSLSFDALAFEFLMALCSGGALYLAPQEDLVPGPAFARLLRKHAVTIVTLPPSALAALEEDDFPALEVITVAGEACPAQLVDRWAPGRRFFNLYGPTEASIWTTVAECVDGGQAPPIGRPIANTRVHILDRHQQPVPIGIPGELCIAGDGLARGYLNRPELTHQRFITDPFATTPGQRLYRTGDLARHRPDGTLEFLGRRDQQIKIRGYRIELGEIAATLEQHPAITTAAVTATPQPHTPGDQRLTAYVTPTNTTTPTELQRHLRHTLPDHMIPSDIVYLDTLPLTPNGKIDRDALPAPDPARRTLAGEYVAPRTPIETELARLWSDVLGVERVGVHDDFFTQLGGHSLRATQVLSRLRATFGFELPLQRFFQAPTVAELAETIVQHEAELADRELLTSTLDELQQLSDDEVQALLDADDPAQWERSADA